MSHFFTHLITRNFDVGEKGERVRPRVPALFETDRAGYQAADLSTVEDETLKTKVSPIRQSIHTDRVSEPRAATPSKSSTIVSANIQDQSRRSTIQHLHQEEPSVSPYLPKLPEDQRITISGENVQQKWTDEKQFYPQPASPIPVEIPAVPVNAHIEQGEEPAALKNAPLLIRPAVVSAEKKVTHRQYAQPGTLLHSNDNLSIQSQTSQPTIHVTIGRVEVRAMTTAAAPVKAPRPSPAPSLSLDDYLKQRQEGRR